MTPQPTPPSRRRLKRLALVLLILPVLVLAAYFLLLLRQDGAWGGSAPNISVLGQRAFVEQAAKAFDCHGVHATPRNTWLLGSVEGSGGVLPAGEPAPVALEQLLPAGEPDAAMADREESRSYLSRLDAQGVFRLVATVNSEACLVASPDGVSLLLLTGLERPAAGGNASASASASSPSSALEQTAVFRSDDQGVTWRWVEAGLFPEAGRFAQFLTPAQFGSALWQWGSLEEASLAEATSAALMAAAPEPEAATTTTVALYYSPDFGGRVQRMDLSADLFTAPSHAKPRLPAGAQLASAGHDDTRLYVVQTAPAQARAWVSQRFAYSYPDIPYVAGYIRTTVTTALVWRDGRWQAGAPERQEGLFLEAVSADPDGHVFAALSNGDGTASAEHIAELKGTTWQLRGELPNPFAPLDAVRGTETLVAAKGALFLGVRAQHTVPRWIYPWGDRAATISGGGEHFSRDGGRSWTQLPRAHVLGLDPVSARLFVADAPWFDSRDLTLRSFGLAK